MVKDINLPEVPVKPEDNKQKTTKKYIIEYDKNGRVISSRPAK